MNEPALLLLEHVAGEGDYTHARGHVSSVGKGPGLSFAQIRR